MDFRARYLFYLVIILACFSVGTLGRLKGEGIVGGDNAEEGQFPYQVLIRSSGKNACGGTIIGERFVVTAAHCVVNRQNKMINVPLNIVAGVTDLNSKSERQVVVDVEQVFALKEFNPSNMYRRITGDIAVLKLHEDLDISGNSKLGTLDLPKDNETFAEVQGVISGFGWNKVEIVMDPITFLPKEVNGVFYGKMRYAKVDVMSNADCAKFYYDPPPNTEICVSVVQRDPKKPEGACTGDSGGPVAYKNTLIGVISRSPMGCRENQKPAVHTRVSEYVDFIRKVVDGKIDDTIRSTTLPITVERCSNQIVY